MRRLTRILVPAAVALIGSFTGVVLLASGPAAAHEERDPAPLPGGTVPQYRASASTALLVCGTDAADLNRRIAAFPADLKTADTALFAQCQKSGYRSLQAAVDAVNQPNVTIKMLPGLYQETPSLTTPSAKCANLPARVAQTGYQVLTWPQQQACPNLQNLVAIQGKTNLQIEGTGIDPSDVVIDAQYRKLMAVRADRSPGLYLRNLTAEHATSTAVYIMESDGFAVDRVIGRWNLEDGIDAYADDHGVITTCETYGNGYAGVGVEATPEPDNRYTVDVHDCNSHANLIGFAGIGGNHVHVHDNTFVGNATGLALVSVAPGSHTGLPQNHATVERNAIGDNNADFYRFLRDGTCAKPVGQRGDDAVCPLAGVPVGAGVVNAGGDDNVFRGNWVYGNSTYGFASWWTPGHLRGDGRVVAQFDTTNRNRYLDNTLGAGKAGGADQNGLDFWWDGQGAGSCWQRTTGTTAVPRTLPACDADGNPSQLTPDRFLGEPLAALQVYVCSRFDPSAGAAPVDCSWYGASGLGRIDVKWALGSAVLIGLLSLLVWARLLSGRNSGLSLLGLLLVLAGLATGGYAMLRPSALSSAALWSPIGLALLGAGWIFLGIPMYRRGRGGLGGLTITLGVLALLGAVDTGLMMIPYLPVAPALLRVGLEVIWAPWTLWSGLRGRVLAGTGRTAPEPYDPLERFAHYLRS
jgi:hypothetical protein